MYKKKKLRYHSKTKKKSSIYDEINEEELKNESPDIDGDLEQIDDSQEEEEGQ